MHRSAWPGSEPRRRLPRRQTSAAFRLVGGVHANPSFAADGSRKRGPRIAASRRSPRRRAARYRVEWQPRRHPAGPGNARGHAPPAPDGRAREGLSYLWTPCSWAQYRAAAWRTQRRPDLTPCISPSAQGACAGASGMAKTGQSRATPGGPESHQGLRPRADGKSGACFPISTETVALPRDMAQMPEAETDRFPFVGLGPRLRVYGADANQGSGRKSGSAGRPLSFLAFWRSSPRRQYSRARGSSPRRSMTSASSA